MDSSRLLSTVKLLQVSTGRKLLQANLDHCRQLEAIGHNEEYHRALQCNDLCATRTLISDCSMLLTVADNRRRTVCA